MDGKEQNCVQDSDSVLVCRFYVNLQNHLSLINNLWGCRKPGWKLNNMMTTEVFQRPLQLFHLCEPETTRFKGNPSSSIICKLFWWTRIEVLWSLSAWKQRIIKSLILKLESVWQKCRWVLNLFLLSLLCDMKPWSRGALLALMSGPDCRGVLV